MNTIKFIIVVSIALLSTDLIYHQIVNGISADCLSPNSAVLYSNDILVIIDLDCSGSADQITKYSKLGFEIKGISEPSNTMYMQKVIP